MFRLPLLALARPARTGALFTVVRTRIAPNPAVFPPFVDHRLRSTSSKAVDPPDAEVGIENQGAADLFDEVEVEAEWDGEEVQEGVFMSLPSPSSQPSQFPSPTSPTAQPADTPTRPRRPQKNSIKHLNRLLSRHAAPEIPESELDEKFVRGRGPGGQAINKTNSSVSLRHIPTGIRIQSQPTRSREQNRMVARQILRERLDLMRARGELPGQQLEVEQKADGGEVGEGKGEEKLSKKERLAAEARLWSKQELRWEKERRRKANRAKKVKRRTKAEEAEGGEDAAETK